MKQNGMMMMNRIIDFKMLLLIASFLLIDHTPVVLAQNTCTFNGKVYQEGQSLGDAFENLCGTPSEYPCYCDPGKNPEAACPYCGFATEDGGLVCARHDETVEFIDVDGVTQSCLCEASDIFDVPSSVCGAVNGKTLETCNIQISDGTNKTYINGQSLGTDVESPCGAGYPCFCNPNYPDQIECPYCQFTSIGYGTVCARDGERVSFLDLGGGYNTCNCQVFDEPGIPFETTCTISTLAQKPGCHIEKENGLILSFDDGENFGDAVVTRCGSAEEFPCFCNSALEEQRYCPYCGFVNGEGTLFCAKDQDTITFQDGSVRRTCSCEIPDDPFQRPIRTCETEDVPTPPTPEPVAPPVLVPTAPLNGCAITNQFGEEEVIPNGSSFGDLVEGPCGPSSVWPAFCNTALSTDIITRQITTQDDNVEYPYCIFDNTLNGDIVCARINGDVRFTDDNGLDITCECTNTVLSGIQTECHRSGQTDHDSDEEPTVAPTVFQPFGNQPTPSPSPIVSSLSSLVLSLIALVTTALLLP